jgi:uncharacterized protein (UPF0332 family)
MNVQDIKKLREKIESIDVKQHSCIFNIFKKYNVQFSENKNGIFINLSEVNSDILKEVSYYLNYLQKQEQVINKIENEKKEYINNFF